MLLIKNETNEYNVARKKQTNQLQVFLYSFQEYIEPGNINLHYILIIARIAQLAWVCAWQHF